MHLFDFVAEFKRHNTDYPEYAYSWGQIAASVNHNTNLEDHRTFASGEELRSWYRRQKKKRDSISSNSALESAAPDPKTPQNTQNGVKGTQGIGSTFESLRMALSSLCDTVADEPQREMTVSQEKEVVYFENVVAMPKAFPDPLTLLNGQYLVLADIHAGYPHMEFLKEAIKRVLDSVYELDGIIIAGDLFDFDGISRHPKTHNTLRLETELEIAAQIALGLADIAPLYVCSGNHDERHALKLDAHFSLQRLIASALNGRTAKHKIVATDYDYIDVGDAFRVGHIDKYSTTPGKIAYDIAQQIKRNVLVGHDHLTGVHYKNGDQFIGASIGCIADHSKFWYANRRLNKMKPFQLGYAVLDQNGGFDLFNADHEVYFSRTQMYSGWYNCHQVK